MKPSQHGMPVTHLLAPFWAHPLTQIPAGAAKFPSKKKITLPTHQLGSFCLSTQRLYATGSPAKNSMCSRFARTQLVLRSIHPPKWLSRLSYSALKGKTNKSQCAPYPNFHLSDSDRGAILKVVVVVVVGGGGGETSDSKWGGERQKTPFSQ